MFQFVDFGEKHGHELVGHTLVWHNQTPDWVFAGKVPPPQSTLPMGEIEPGQMKPAYAGPRATREELLERMPDHIHKVVGRYKGRVKTWDVANEVLAEGNVENDLRDSLWLQIIGPDFIAKAFQYAHEADPDAILRYNDYGLEKPAKAQRLIRLIKSLQEQKVPIHAIGTQAHLNLDAAGFDQFDRSLAEIAKLGLPIHVTELDIHGGDKGDQKLALAYEGVFRAIMKHRESVKMVTFWGVSDAVSWLRDGSPLLFDGDCRPKAALDAVIRVAHEAPLASHDLTPMHDATRVLENPHKGWYHHFPDNHPNKYLIARDADLLDFPGMDHLYIRLAWAYLEPKEGQFDWSVIDRIIDKWTGKGLGIALRISGKETSTDRMEQQYATPLWVKHAGAKGGHYKKGNPVGPDAPWEPVYDDPVFLEKLEKFLAAYAARYDGKPWVRYVDIGSIGDWGEGHSWASSRKVLSFAVRKTHIDLHLKYFKRSQLMISEDYGPQAYSMRTTDKPSMAYWVFGGDATGTMYGGLQLAEIVQFNGLAKTYDAQESPHIKNRGIKFNIPLDKESPTYFYGFKGTSHRLAVEDVWEMDFWKTWFDEMARHRYNVLSLWSPHPFTSMVNMEDEYPGVAIKGVTGFDEAGKNKIINDWSIDQKIDYWRNVMQYGKDRGFDIYMCNWNVFLSTAKGKHGMAVSDC